MICWWRYQCKWKQARQKTVTRQSSQFHEPQIAEYRGQPASTIKMRIRSPSAGDGNLIFASRGVGLLLPFMTPADTAPAPLPRHPGLAH